MMNDYTLPANWNELSAKEILFLLKLTLNNISPQECKVRMFLFCIKANVKQKRNGMYLLKIGQEKYFVSPDWVNEQAEKLDFLLSQPDEQGNRYIYPKLTRNPFPIIKSRFRKLKGPADGLIDITYDQFIYLQTYQNQIQNIEKAIDFFVSVIYLYKSKSNLKLVSHLSQEVKMAIFWFYLGCLDFISEKFPLTFSGGGEAKGSVYENQMRIVNTLANGDVTKKPEVRNANLYDALYSMEMAVEEHEKMTDIIK
jgi:hypothetical protein